MRLGHQTSRQIWSASWRRCSGERASSCSDECRSGGGVGVEGRDEIEVEVRVELRGGGQLVDEDKEEVEEVEDVDETLRETMRRLRARKYGGNVRWGDWVL